jgi:thiol:disulfide interchange protein DsbD
MKGQTSSATHSNETLNVPCLRAANLHSAYIAHGYKYLYGKTIYEMRLFYYGAIAMVLMLAGAGKVAAQILKPAKWKFEAKKLKSNEYQLVFHLNLEKGWHIWSLSPGGDGYQIVPSVAYDNNALVKTTGALAEKGKVTSGTMAGIKGIVNYLSGNVDYTQNVTVKGATKLTGRFTYQVCDDKQCLAPADAEFSFDLK